MDIRLCCSDLEEGVELLLLLQVDEARALMDPPSSYPPDVVAPMRTSCFCRWMSPHGCSAYSSCYPHTCEQQSRRCTESSMPCPPAERQAGVGPAHRLSAPSRVSIHGSAGYMVQSPLTIEAQVTAHAAVLSGSPSRGRRPRAVRTLRKEYFVEPTLWD